MSDTQLSQNHGVYGGRGPEVMGVSWALMGVTTIIIAIRIYVRFFMFNEGSSFRGLWALIWAISAWILGVAGMSCISVAVHYGYGSHIEIVEAQGDLKLALLFNWIWSTFSTMMIVVAKFSVVAFLLDLQGPTHRYQKWFLIFLAVSSLCFNIITEFFIWFQCDPPRKIYDVTVSGTCPRRTLNYHFALFSGSWGAFVDLYLALYPIVIVYNLNIRLKLKLTLVGLMGLGVFTAVCSCMKTYELKAVKGSSDATYDSVPLALWGIAESWVVLIASGIPPTWPFINKAFERAHINFTDSFFNSFGLRSLFSRRSSAVGSRGGLAQPNPTRGADSSDTQRTPTPSSTLHGDNEQDEVDEDKISVTRDVTVGHEDRHENDARDGMSDSNTWEKAA